MNHLKHVNYKTNNEETELNIDFQNVKQKKTINKNIKKYSR